MKQFLIGDGHKRISCPDAYLADTEDTETTVIWHPEHHEIPMWNSIAKPGNAVASPAWHGEVLAVA